MKYIYDIWVNWCEGESSRHHVWYFHEWRKQDHIELLEQAPVIKVPSLLFQQIEQGMNELPKKLLKNIYQKASVRKKNRKHILSHCTVLVTENESLVIDTIGYTIPLRKSHLTPRHEKLVISIAKLLEIPPYLHDVKLLHQEEEQLFPPECAYIGLTRKEKQQKRILFSALEMIKQTNNIMELRYWYTECFPNNYEQSLKLDFQTMWTDICQLFLHSWTNKHYEISVAIIKKNSYLRQQWQIEADECLY